MKQFFKQIYKKLPVIRELREIKQELVQSRIIQTNAAHSALIRSVDFELSNHPRYADPLRLLRFESQVSSQAGEDGIIHEIFRRIGSTNRIFAEIGVGDGTENNTSFLLSQGWTGFWIDLDDSFIKTIQHRPDLPADCLSYKVASINRENAATLFAELQVPTEPDLLSIDVDQNTLFVWEGLETYRPRVVVIEYNSVIPPDVEWSVNYDPNRSWDGSQNVGSSLKSIELLGSKFGYSLVGCNFTGTNAFLVRSDLVAGKFSEPFTAENHYEPPRGSTIPPRQFDRTILDRKLDSPSTNAG